MINEPDYKYFNDRIEELKEEIKINPSKRDRQFFQELINKCHFVDKQFHHYVKTFIKLRKYQMVNLREKIIATKELEISTKKSQQALQELNNPELNKQLKNIAPLESPKLIKDIKELIALEHSTDSKLFVEIVNDLISRIYIHLFQPNMNEIRKFGDEAFLENLFNGVASVMLENIKTAAELLTNFSNLIPSQVKKNLSRHEGLLKAIYYEPFDEELIKLITLLQYLNILAENQIDNYSHLSLKVEEAEQKLKNKN